MPKTCYICGTIAESKEHTPARCYFPEKSEYRTNLITVPSCKLHNQDTSKDDEYVRNLIAMSLGTNAVAYKQFIEKTIEGFKHSSGLLKSTTGTRMNISIEGQASYAFQIDRDRFNRVMRKISYALYYHANKQPWNRELIVTTKNLYTEKIETDEMGNLIQDYELFLPTNNFDGHNPQVFKYRFGDTNSNDIHEKVLRMIFYEGFHVWIIPRTGTTAPRID